MKDKFYHIVNLGLWGDECIYGTFPVYEHEIVELHETAKSQALSGIFIDGLNVCEAEFGKHKISLIKELMYIENINRKISNIGERMLDLLDKNGIKAEIFKGCSVAKWYINPLHRGFGDIDIVTLDGFEKIEEVLKSNGIAYKHEHQDIVCSAEGINIEFHKYREYAFNPIINKRLKRLVSENMDSPEVYLACIILHIRRHVLTYGIGMKQICDVAVMLKYANINMARMSGIIKELNMEKFSAALFGFIKRRFMINTFPVTPDCGNNSFLVENIVWNDGYMLKTEREKHNHGLSPLKRVLDNALFWIKRSTKLFYMMPSEAVCFPIYMAYRRVFYMKN